MSLVLAGAALVALTTFAASRRDTRRLAHTVATLIAGTSLIFLALGSQERRDSIRAVVLTEGTEPSQVESVLEDDLPLFDLDPSRLWSLLDRRIRVVRDLAALRRRYPEIRHLDILGNGLDSASWGELLVADHRVAGTLPLGPTQIRWRRTLELGQTFEVAGRLQRAGSEPALDLVGPDGRVRKLDLPDDDGASGFSFQDRPRSTGHLRYELRLGEGRWTLDVHVRPAVPRRILWIEDSPGFESRFLLSRWREAGHSLAVRRRISRDRFQTEFHAMQEVDIGRLRPDLLSSLDLAVLDGPAWQRLSLSEKNLLEAAVRDQGVGLLLLVDDPDAIESSPREIDAWLPQFVVRPVSDLDSIDVRAVWQTREPAPSLALSAAYIEPSDDLRPLAWDPHGRLLAAASAIGSGQVGLSLLTRTHPWILQGHQEIHDDLWNHLLSSLLRPRFRPEFEMSEDRPLLQDRAIPFILHSEQEAPVVTLETPSSDEWSIALRQDDLDPTLWHGSLWPRESGLHRLQSNELRLDFLVHPDSAWSAWLASLRRQETRERMEGEEGRSHETAKGIRRTMLGLLLISILALAFSWIADVF